MKLLALDTSTDACSAAVYLDGAWHDRLELAPRSHARLMLAMVEAVLTEAGVELDALDALAFGRGPGSFTGVRIAAAAIQAFAFGHNLPVVPVSSLRALAQAAFELHGSRRCAAAFDARMDEVYYGAFEIDAEGIARCVHDERVCSPESVPLLPGSGWSGAGSGWGAYGSRLLAALDDDIAPLFPDLCPRARDVARIAAVEYEQGRVVSAEAALPVYLRDTVTRI